MYCNETETKQTDSQYGSSTQDLRCRCKELAVAERLKEKKKYGLSAVTKKVVTAEKFFARTKHQESHFSVFLCNPTKQCRNLAKSVRRETKTDNSYRWFTEALRKFLRATLPSPCCANLHIIIVRGRAYKKASFSI